MEVRFKTKGVCSTEIVLQIDENIVKEVTFIGGCPGNTYGVGELVKGMEVSEVISRLDGITCRKRPTSCPDQLAQALKEAIHAYNA